MTTKDTIEQRILEMQGEKWAMADSVLGETSGFANTNKARKLSVAELFKLFGIYQATNEPKRSNWEPYDENKLWKGQ